MLISFEGCEGSGKTTLLRSLQETFKRESDHTVVMTTQPGGSVVGKQTRAILLDSRNKITPIAELLLYFADRVQHSVEVIQPALTNNCLVISDRYHDSSIAYQGYGRGHNLEFIQNMTNLISAYVIKPDITFLLNVDVKTGLIRARTRNSEVKINESRFDDELLEFHERVHAGYLEIAKNEPERVIIINANNTPDEMLYDVITHLYHRNILNPLCQINAHVPKYICSIDKADGLYSLYDRDKLITKTAFEYCLEYIKAA